MAIICGRIRIADTPFPRSTVTLAAGSHVLRRCVSKELLLRNQCLNFDAQCYVAAPCSGTRITPSSISVNLLPTVRSCGPRHLSIFSPVATAVHVALAESRSFDEQCQVEQALLWIPEIQRALMPCHPSGKCSATGPSFPAST